MSTTLEEATMPAGTIQFLQDFVARVNFANEVASRLAAQGVADSGKATETFLAQLQAAVGIVYGEDVAEQAFGKQREDAVSNSPPVVAPGFQAMSLEQRCRGVLEVLKSRPAKQEDERVRKSVEAQLRRGGWLR